MTNEFDFATATRLSTAATAAFNELDALDSDDCTALRDLLIDRSATPDLDDDFTPDAATYDRIRALLADIDARLNYPASDSTRTRFSMMLLDFSLCPMHAFDYAICFDDDTDECAAIRAYFPSHDT